MFQFNGSFPMVEAACAKIQQPWSTEQKIDRIAKVFLDNGPYICAKVYDQLVNESGEEFAMQFMSLYNSLRPGTF